MNSNQDSNEKMVSVFLDFNILLFWGMCTFLGQQRYKVAQHLIKRKCYKNVQPLVTGLMNCIEKNSIIKVCVPPKIALFLKAIEFNAFRIFDSISPPKQERLIEREHMARYFPSYMRRRKKIKELSNRLEGKIDEQFYRNKSYNTIDPQDIVKWRQKIIKAFDTENKDFIKILKRHSLKVCKKDSPIENEDIDLIIAASMSECDLIISCDRHFNNKLLDCIRKLCTSPCADILSKLENFPFCFLCQEQILTFLKTTTDCITRNELQNCINNTYRCGEKS